MTPATVQPQRHAKRGKARLQARDVCRHLAAVEDQAGCRQLIELRGREQEADGSWSGDTIRWPVSPVQVSGTIPPAAPARLPGAFARLAWSNLAAQSAEQVAVAAVPIVAVLA